MISTRHRAFHHPGLLRFVYWVVVVFPCCWTLSSQASQFKNAEIIKKSRTRYRTPFIPTLHYHLHTNEMCVRTSSNNNNNNNNHNNLFGVQFFFSFSFFSFPFSLFPFPSFCTFVRTLLFPSLPPSLSKVHTLSHMYISLIYRSYIPACRPSYVGGGSPFTKINQPKPSARMFLSKVKKTERFCLSRGIDFLKEEEKWTTYGPEACVRKVCVTEKTHVRSRGSLDSICSKREAVGFLEMGWGMVDICVQVWEN